MPEEQRKIKPLNKWKTKGKCKWKVQLDPALESVYVLAATVCAFVCVCVCLCVCSVPPKVFNVKIKYPIRFSSTTKATLKRQPRICLSAFRLFITVWKCPTSYPSVQSENARRTIENLLSIYLFNVSQCFPLHLGVITHP